MADADRFAPYLAASVREYLEVGYYARINAEARLERVLLRPDAWDGHTPTFLMPDHGVVHVRDVAGLVLDVIDLAHGVVIPLRDEVRLEFMRALAVTLAYLHDIGMVDASPRGRLDHPTVAAQAVFTRAFDPLVATVWCEDRGGVASRLALMVAAGAATGPGERVLREVLALSLAHSKRAVPIDVLNDPAALRRTMLARLGVAFDDEAFAWLIAGDTGAGDLVHDVIDTLRVLRCADALRQRGLVHKTSGGYEVFVSRKTGRAVHALRRTDDELYLLEWDNEHSAGEANVAASSLTPGGDLRIAFHVGAFGSPEALDRAVSAAAFVVHDIMGDVLESFRRPDSGALAATTDMRVVVGGRVLLECADDAPEFSLQVRHRLGVIDPGSSGRIDVVASLDGAPDHECDRYLSAPSVAEDAVETDVILRHLRAAGFESQSVDAVAAFADVRVVTLERHEVLVRAGTLAAFVYVPLDDGLEVRPMGGYRSFPARAFIPIGSTGVIRGGPRNADVLATDRVQVLVIPRSQYLTHWYRPYSLLELRQRLVGQPTNEREALP